MSDQKTNKTSIRVWVNFDLHQVKKNLLLIDDLYGVCANCKQVGLNYIKDKSCPKCKSQFHYLATKQTNLAEVVKILHRIQIEKLDIQLIDRNDFERGDAKSKLGEVFLS